MREYGTVKTAFWTDPKIANLPRDAKYLALYLLTSPHTNALGCFRAPCQYIAADVGEQQCWVCETVAVLIDEEWCEYHEETGWVWIRNYLKHNKPANGNVFKKCWKEFAQIPSSIPFKDAVHECLKAAQEAV